MLASVTILSSKLTSPFTSNFAPGFVVPIPTLPFTLKLPTFIGAFIAAESLENFKVPGIEVTAVGLGYTVPWKADIVKSAL